jgi:hypothetical protein
VVSRTCVSGFWISHSAVCRQWIWSLSQDSTKLLRAVIRNAKRKRSCLSMETAYSMKDCFANKEALQGGSESKPRGASNQRCHKFLCPKTQRCFPDTLKRFRPRFSSVFMLGFIRFLYHVTCKYCKFLACFLCVLYRVRLRTMRRKYL